MQCRFGRTCCSGPLTDKGCQQTLLYQGLEALLGQWQASQLRLPKEKRVHWGEILRIGKVANCHLRHHLDYRSETLAWTGISSLHGNQSWDDNLDLFGLKITRDLARAFLMHILLTVLPQDCLNSGAKTNTMLAVFLLNFLVVFPL
jgi:hypothetical protein